MHDHAAMIMAVGQEGAADPAQIMGLLLVDRDARADAGMDEQIIAEAERVAEAFEEGDMRRGHGGAEHLGDPRFVHRLQRGRIDAVARRAGVPAEPQPVISEPGFAREHAQQDLFVIAEQEQRLGREMVERSQPFDDARGVRAAIDQVAQEHDRRGVDRTIMDVVLDPPQQVVDQIEPAMDIADRV